MDHFQYLSFRATNRSSTPPAPDFPILCASSAQCGNTLSDTLYYLIWGCLLGAYCFCRMLVGSRFGRVFRGAKENALRMETIGFNVYRFQLAAYVIAGMMAGLSGFLLANATEFVSPAYMSWQRSGDLIIMVILGGLGSLHGAIIGAGAYLLLEEWLSAFTEDWKVIFGPFLVLVVLFARGGINGLLEGTASQPC